MVLNYFFSIFCTTFTDKNLTKIPLIKTDNTIYFSALLAANPSLANAAPGSLVVVASPSSSSNPNSQLLQVFVVGGASSNDQVQIIF
jgi:hypothetical protein